MEYAWGVFQLAKRYFKIQSLSVSSPAHQFNCIRTQGYLQLIGFSDQRLVLFLLVYLKLNRQVPAARIFILSFPRCSSFLKFLCSPYIFPHPSLSLSLSLHLTVLIHSFFQSSIYPFCFISFIFLLDLSFINVSYTLSSVFNTTSTLLNPYEILTDDHVLDLVLVLL